MFWAWVSAWAASVVACWASACRWFACAPSCCACAHACRDGWVSCRSISARRSAMFRMCAWRSAAFAAAALACAPGIRFRSRSNMELAYRLMPWSPYGLPAGAGGAVTVPDWPGSTADSLESAETMEPAGSAPSWAGSAPG